jgi:hypothetical protein
LWQKQTVALKRFQLKKRITLIYEIIKTC